jgi:hypothetical protein
VTFTYVDDLLQWIKRVLPKQPAPALVAETS